MPEIFTSASVSKLADSPPQAVAAAAAAVSPPPVSRSRPAVTSTTSPAPAASSSKLPIKRRPPAATVEDATDSEDERQNRASAKGKAREAARAARSAAAAAVPTHDWQAVWSPPQNAYYFYNCRTMETTWTNPLASNEAAATSTEQPDDTASGGESPPWDPSVETLPTASAATAPVRAASYPTGASFSYGQPSGSGGPPSYGGVWPSYPSGSAGAYGSATPSAAAYGAQGRLNPRTGRYEADSATQASVYANTQRSQGMTYDRQREAELERERDAGGSKRKRATREDVAAFKAKKEEKRKRNNGWLRS